MDFNVGIFYAPLKSSLRDTLYENLTGDRFYGTPVAVQHIMPDYTNDTLATFGSMCFQSMEMLESMKGDFIVLSARNESAGVNNFQQLLAYMESKHGKAKVAEGYAFSQFFTYSWTLNDRELILLVTGKELEYISSLLDRPQQLKTAQTDATTLPSINTIVFVFNKKFDKSFTTSKVKSGEFLLLDSVNFSSRYRESKS